MKPDVEALDLDELADRWFGKQKYTLGNMSWNMEEELKRAFKCGVMKSYEIIKNGVD